MKILAINGSGRPGGNTKVLLDAILRGAADGGHETAMLELAKLKISPCTSCRRCKDSLKCVLDDDMKLFYDQVESTDMLLLGSPIYMGHITANMMTFLHRLYCYLDSGIVGHYPKPSAQMVSALTYGAPDDTLYDEPLNYMSFVMDRYFKIPTVKKIKLSAAKPAPLVTDEHPIIRDAMEFGKSL